MKFNRRENLNYYLEELVWYNMCMKKGELKSLPVFTEGKSIITAKKDFRILKSYQIFNYFFQEGSFMVYRTKGRKKEWNVLTKFSSVEAERWLVYYFDYFFKMAKMKGLKTRNFAISGGWIFYFKEVGELRISELYFDYYDWDRVWMVFLHSKELENLIYSSLKIRYKYAIFNRERL